jgi:hypothetical protein
MQQIARSVTDAPGGQCRALLGSLNHCNPNVFRQVCFDKTFTWVEIVFPRFIDNSHLTMIRGISVWNGLVDFSFLERNWILEFLNSDDEMCFFHSDLFNLRNA